MEFMYEDCKSLLEEVNLQEKELRHKRRWLIGLPISRSEAGKSKGYHFRIARNMPECLLREDDVSYDTIKSFVEKGCGGCNSQQMFCYLQDNMQLLYSPKDVKDLLSLIDNMTNQGLLRFAELLTGGSVKFENTRWKTKKIIKSYLSEVFSKQKNIQRMNLSPNYYLLLTNPHNFRWSSEARFILDPKSYRAAVLKILDVLEFLPTQTLSAMRRKLSDEKGYMPQLTPQKSGWGRDALIKRVRKKCMGLLSKLGDEDALQEPLANAMEVASLTLKLIRGCQYIFSFKQFSPEINLLQNDIAMCIQLLDRRVKLPVLKDIKLLLDPKAKSSDKTLRASLRNMLSEFLFECGCMDTAPQCLLEVLALIKQSSETPYKHLLETKIEEEVECILSVSASAKQVLWDLLPERELDLEFADAYIEDPTENDCEDLELEAEHMQNDMSCSISFEERVGSSDEVIPAICEPVEAIRSMEEMKSINHDSATFLTGQGGCSLISVVPNSLNRDGMQYHLVSLINTEQMDVDSPTFTDNQDGFLPFSPDECTLIQEENPDSSEFSSAERNLILDKQNTCKNEYLAVQAACDETSMVAYCLIGHMLDNFAQIEGCELKSSDVSYLRVKHHDSEQKNCRDATKEPTIDAVYGCSTIIKAAEEIIPSFGEWEKERLKELMGGGI